MGAGAQGLSSPWTGQRSVLAFRVRPARPRRNVLNAQRGQGFRGGPPPPNGGARLASKTLD